MATAATSVASRSFTANWNATTGAVSYQLDVSSASDFSSYVTGYENLSVAALTQAISGLVGETTYYYRVRALYEDGSISGSSNTISLTTLQAVDDEGYCFPGTANQRISTDVSTLFNGVTKLTTLVWFKVNSTGAFQTLFSVWNDSTPNDLRDQWLCALNTSNRLFWGAWNTASSARAFATGNTQLVDDGVYCVAFVYDGTASTNALKLKMFVARLVGNAYENVAQETVTFTGASVPTSLSSLTGAGLAFNLGNTLAGNQSPFAGGLIAVRNFITKALSASEIDAEDATSDPSAASLRWELNGSAVQTGSESGYDGTPTANVTVCSITP